MWVMCRRCSTCNFPGCCRRCASTSDPDPSQPETLYTDTLTPFHSHRHRSHAHTTHTRTNLHRVNCDTVSVRLGANHTRQHHWSALVSLLRAVPGLMCVSVCV